MSPNEIRNYQVEYTIFFKDDSQEQHNGNFAYHGNPSSKEDVLFALDGQEPEIDWSRAQKVTFTVYEIANSDSRTFKHAGEVTESEILMLLASAPE